VYVVWHLVESRRSSPVSEQVSAAANAD